MAIHRIDSETGIVWCNDFDDPLVEVGNSVRAGWADLGGLIEYSPSELRDLSAACLEAAAELERREKGGSDGI